MKEQIELTTKDPLSLYLWKAAVNAAHTTVETLRLIAEGDPDPKHKKMLEESIRATKAKEN